MLRSRFPQRGGAWARAILALAAAILAGGCGCFVFVSPERAAADIPCATPGDTRYYRIFDDGDDFSCMRIHLPPPSFPRPVPAVVIFPGGAYGVLALDREGNDYAEFLSRHGVAGFVVKYPLGSIFGGYRRHPAMLDAARQAIRLVRAHASALGVDPGRVGVMGSSAGGHLAGLVAVAADDASTRPDFAVLCYPVVTMVEEEYVHRMSRSNLLGDSPPPELLAELSLEKQVTPDCPPTFLWFTLEDENVHPKNGLLLEAALATCRVPHTTCVYERGAHGMGLVTGENTEKYPEAAQWTTEMLRFMRREHILAE